MKKLTIIDIARLAGVGKSTVSRVINNDKKVSQETKERVLEVIKENNYKPSQSAQNMRLKKNKVIGIINTRLESKSETKVIKNILNTLYEDNYDAIILESLFSQEKTVKHIEVLKNKNIAGIIIFAISTLEYNFLKKLKIPIIMVAKKVEGFTSIAYDDYGAIECILSYLIKNKYKNIAYIGVDNKDITTGFQRYSAYRDYTIRYNKENISYFGDFSYNSGYNLAKQLFLEEKQVDSIVCASDSIALGVKKYLDKHQIKKVIVTGVGNDPLIKFLYDDYISISFGYDTVGKLAGEAILDKIKKKDIKDIIIDGNITL